MEYSSAHEEEEESIEFFELVDVTDTEVLSGDDSENENETCNVLNEHNYSIVPDCEINCEHNYSLVLGGSSLNEINNIHELLTNNIDDLIAYDPTFGQISYGSILDDNAQQNNLKYKYSPSIINDIKMRDPFFGTITYDSLPELEPEISATPNMIGKVSIIGKYTHHF